MWSDTETQKLHRKRKAHSELKQINRNLAWEVAAHVMWAQWTGRESEYFLRDKNRSWQLLRLKQIVTKLLGQPPPQTYSYTSSLSVTQLLVAPLVSCGRWRQIHAVWNNGPAQRSTLVISFQKVKRGAGPLAEVKPMEEEMWVDADGRGAAAPVGGQTTLSTMGQTTEQY